MFNDDVEIAICKPDHELDAFYRNGEGDEVLFVHEGSGVVETIFGSAALRAATTTSSSRAARRTGCAATTGRRRG